jgi:long-chain acyl-CoA synthetase
VSNATQLAKVDQIRGGLPHLKHVIIFDKVPAGTHALWFDEVVTRGREARSRYPDWKAQALRAAPEDLATLIYTSGTTGDPKGVMLTHGNITSNVIGGLTVLGLRETDECLSFLPLSHIFERMAGHYCMMRGGVIINYALSVETVSNDMIDRSPTVVLSVPRLYEKIYARVLENALAGSSVKKQIFFWAKKTAEAWADLALAKQPIPGALALKKKVADRLVFSKLKARTGGKLRFFVSGGAPLSADIAKFFYAAGLPIMEGYGLTETSPVITVNTLDNIRIGTVGRPIPRVTVRIAPDGEILTKGPNVMKGYYRKPEATAEVLDADGTFHTGDIGEIDPDGFLRITDRKKELIINAYGKNIAPAPIENALKSSRFIGQAVVIGDRRKFLSALLVPDFEALKPWAERQGIGAAGNKDLIQNAQVRALIAQEVANVNSGLASFEKIVAWELLPEEWTLETGELTPTQKVKRRVINQKYGDILERLYQESEAKAS